MHTIRTWAGTAAGTLEAPDQSTPPTSSCASPPTEGGLTATASRRLDARTARLRVATDPPGLQAFLGSSSGPAPLERT